MDKLVELKNCKTKEEFAKILGYKTQKFTYILYKLPKEKKCYHEFIISKSSGGERKIHAPIPHLKELQSRLSDLLQECYENINNSYKVKHDSVHGFKKNKSIMTNAIKHRNKRFVFNIDIKDFFGSINFGRIRGFLIHDNKFKLNDNIATIIAQIACYNHVLPQGSPCSPVISNILGNLLDVHLNKIAYKNGLIYSRYADDITFSTNKKIFPENVAIKSSNHTNSWEPGKDLLGALKRANFLLNNKKTRMQFKDSRQDVTGLIVNKKINVKYEYRKKIRAMVHSLLTTGNFYIQNICNDKLEVNSRELKNEINSLYGMINFVNSVIAYNEDHLKKSFKENKENKEKKYEHKSSWEKTCENFLIYKYLYNAEFPTILTEGKTDPIYLKCAIHSLSYEFKSPNKQVHFFSYNKTNERYLHIGGTDKICNFIKNHYLKKIGHQIKTSVGLKSPIIIITDNDSAGNKLYKELKEYGNKNYKTLEFSNFLHVAKNVYIIKIPLIKGMNECSIEDLFDEEIINKTIDGKKFSPKSDFDKNKEYGKWIFATKIVQKHRDEINFGNFKMIFDIVNSVLEHFYSEIIDKI